MATPNPIAPTITQFANPATGGSTTNPINNTAGAGVLGGNQNQPTTTITNPTQPLTTALQKTTGNNASSVPQVYLNNADWIRPGENTQDYFDRVSSSGVNDSGKGASGTGTGAASSNSSTSGGSNPSDTGLGVAGNTSPIAASNFFASPTSTPQDVTNALQKNIATYAQSGQQTQAELDAQQAVAQAVLQTQRHKMAASTAALGQYTTGAPADLVTAQVGAINLAQSKQLEADTYARDVAQQGLAIAQQNRQIRAQVAQQVVQDQISMAQFSLPYNQLTAAEKLSLGIQLYTSTGDSSFLPTGSVGSNGSADNTSQQETNVENTGSTVSTISGDNILGYDMSSYAADPAHSNKVTSILTSLPNNMMQPGQIQSYINQNFPSSPITGQMISNAATKAGIPPSLLTSLLQEESGFGTKGAATSTNNPGNIGNTGTSTKAFPNWDAGVQGTADWLKNHFVGEPQPTQPNAATNNADTLTQVKKLFNTPEQNGVHVTSGGIPYVDLSEVPPSMQTAAQTTAARDKIKAFTGSDAAGIQSLDAIMLALNQMTPIATSELLPAAGGFGTAATTIKNWWGSTTGTNPKLADFQLQKDSAIKAVQALAGGQGSGLRLNTGTIEAAVSNLPSQSDSQEVALEKINKTRDLLVNQLSIALGNPAIQNGVLQYGTHTYLPGDIVSSNGKLGIVNGDGTITPQ